MAAEDCACTRCMRTRAGRPHPFAPSPRPSARAVAGGAGCDEMPYPADQLGPAAAVAAKGAAPGACAAWCADEAVRARFEAHAIGREGEPCRLCDRSIVYAR